jgi:transposase-like protein
MDEIYINAQGERAYLYRTADKEGDIIDFILSKDREV